MDAVVLKRKKAQIEEQQRKLKDQFTFLTGQLQLLDDLISEAEKAGENKHGEDELQGSAEQD